MRVGQGELNREVPLSRPNIQECLIPVPRELAGDQRSHHPVRPRHALQEPMQRARIRVVK